MTDAMKWFCANYILPEAEKQPMGREEQVCLDLVKNELSPSVWDALSTVEAFYAAHGFRLGLKLGTALGAELRCPPVNQT